MSKVFRFSSSKSPAAMYGVAVLVTLLALLFRLSLNPVLGDNAPLLVFIMPILLTSWYGGLWPGLFATVLSGTVGTYFFVTPGTTLALIQPADVIRIAIFTAEGILISLLCQSLHVSRQRVEQDAQTIQGLLATEQEARQDAERANRRLQFLAEANLLLANSLDYQATLGQLAEFCVPDIADWCVIDIVTREGTLERVSVVHADAAKLAWAQQYQRQYPPHPESSTGAYNVLRTGRPEFHPQVPDTALQAVARDERHLELLRQLGLNSVIIVPLGTRDGVLGTLTLVHAESGRTYTRDDLMLAEELARRAAVAVENAHLYNQTRQLNEELEERVLERTQQLERLNQELETFSYSVSHDLRAPLRGMTGFSRVLLEDYADKLDDTAVRYIERIAASGERMGALIDALLNLSQVSRVDVSFTRIDLTELAQGLLADLQRTEPGRDVVTRVQDDLFAYGDERLLRQVMQNLLENAWKYTRKQAHATIEVGCRDGVFFVCDNGAGFDMAYANKLFAAFQRLHTPAEFEGTGIGLATVQRIINRHGGRIWAEAEEGKGATFSFTLPQDRDEIPARPDSGMASAALWSD